MNLLFTNKIKSALQSVLHMGQMLNSMSYKNVLNRGYVIVRNKDKIIDSASEFTRPAQIEFKDGTIDLS